jgi:hypothetical protein
MDKEVCKSNKISAFLFFLIAFLEGGVLMGNELLFSKIYAVTYGISINAWLKMLLFTLVFLAIGYYFGGKIKNHKRYLILIFSSALIFQIFLIYGSKNLFSLIAEKESFLFQMIYIIYSIGVMAFLMGLVTPLLINSLKSNETNSKSFYAGIIYGTSTLGGVLICLIFGLNILPNFGIYTANYFLIIMLLSCLLFLLILVFKKSIV